MSGRGHQHRRGLPARARSLAPVPAPAEVTLTLNMTAHAQEVRSLPIGTSPPSPAPSARARRPRCAGATEPACAGTNIRKSARDHYLVNKLLALLSKNIRVRRRAVAARSPSRNGVAHANSFPAAGRLMRAGHAGAGGGSDARAHRLPSLSRGASENQCERDHDTSLSQRRLVNTNRPRSRDKYSTFTLRRTRARLLIASRRAPHTRRSRIARAIHRHHRPRPLPTGVLHFI